jgi:DNA-binding transcriptional regulator YiaG
MTLDELLAELKHRHHLTDTEIAATLGVSERTLHRWVAGGTGVPSPAKAKVLVAMFNHGDEIKQKLDALFEGLLKMADTEQTQNASG